MTPYRSVRTPRLKLLVNDVLVSATLNAEITQTSLGGAGRFHFAISTSEVPGFGPSYWSQIDRVYVDVQISLDGGSTYEGMIEGYCDTILLDPILGIAYLDGRDLSAPLFQTKTPTDFQNQTSSEIVTRIARNHNLNPVVTDTASLVGRYYGDNRNIINLAQSAKISSDWDILSSLAQKEEFDLFVAADSLYFQPFNLLEQQISCISFGDLLSIKMERVLPALGGTDVIVRSWNSASSCVVSETISLNSSSTNSVSSAAAAQIYTIVKPNLHSDEASIIGQQASQVVQAQSMSIEITMLGETTIMPRQSLTLYNTDTAFDQLYRVESVVRRLRSQSGFTQTIRAKRSSMNTS